MPNKIQDKLIELNRKEKTVKQIAEAVGLTRSKITRLLLKDSRYRPGKRGFARLAPEEIKKLGSIGGKESQRRGTAHIWSKKEAQRIAKNRRKKR